jgi:Cysteine sulfinate desulfinase/cysteine desulfurase and related enzymes
MWANNEVGTVQPVAQIAQLCREYSVPFHTDAVQALGQLPMHLSEVGATAVTISGHKIGGPVGTGALIIDPYTTVEPVAHGGGQEREIRSGTLDAAGAAALAAAVHYAVEQQGEHARHVAALQSALVEGIRREVPDAIINGAEPDDSITDGGRLPGNVHVSIPGAEGDALLMLLDAAGVDCSTGSACTAGIPEPSHVLLAMGVDERTARSSLRFSFGRTFDHGRRPGSGRGLARGGRASPPRRIGSPHPCTPRSARSVGRAD